MLYEMVNVPNVSLLQQSKKYCSLETDSLSYVRQNTCMIDIARLLPILLTISSQFVFNQFQTKSHPLRSSHTPIIVAAEFAGNVASLKMNLLFCKLDPNLMEIKNMLKWLPFHLSQILEPLSLVRLLWYSRLLLKFWAHRLYWTVYKAIQYFWKSWKFY